MVSAHQTYGALVKDEGDMVGHVAYALYKRDKLSFIEAVKAGNGKEPSEDELSAFIVTSNLALRIDAYRSEAEQALQVFSQAVLDESLIEVQQRYDAQLVAELSRPRSWLRAITESLLANLLAVAVLALLAVLLYGTRIGFAKLAADALGYELVPKAAPR